MTKCPKCRARLEQDELPDGLPGILYDICNGCGWVRAAPKTEQARWEAEKRRENRNELGCAFERTRDWEGSQ